MQVAFETLPSLLDPLEEEDEAEGLAFATDVPNEGNSAQVVYLLHLLR